MLKSTETITEAAKTVLGQRRHPFDFAQDRLCQNSEGMLPSAEGGTPTGQPPGTEALQGQARQFPRGLKPIYEIVRRGAEAPLFHVAWE